MSTESLDDLQIESGSIFTDDGDLAHYLMWGAGVFALMTLAYLFWWTLFTKCYELKRYKYVTQREKYMYLQIWASNSHHVVLVIWSLVILFNPDCGEDSYAFQLFSDDECFQKVDKKAVYLVIMMTNYMLFDLCVNVFLIKIQTDMDKVLVVHHVVAITGTLAALCAGYGTINLSLFLCMTEFSTIPLNRRNMMTKSENKKPIGLCNNLFFALSFFVFRVLNMPWCIYKMVITLQDIWGKVSGFRQACLVYGAIQIFILTVLNYYWFYKVVMMTTRMLGYGKQYNKFEKKPSLRGQNEDLQLDLGKYEEDDHVHDEAGTCCEVSGDNDKFVKTNSIN